MQEDKPTQDSPVSSARFSRRSFPVSRNAIIIVIIALVVVGGAAAVYFIHFAPLQKSSDTTTAATQTAAQKAAAAVAAVKTAHQTAVQEQQTKIDTLVNAGDPQSVQQATTIADQQVATAQQSGDDDYIVEANLAKAGILINNQQYQEAIDTILLPLLQQYQATDALKYRIDGFLAWAYRGLGDETTADKYFSQIPVQGEN